MSASLATLLSGLDHHRSGRLAEASRLYGTVSSEDAHYALALTYRGLAALAGGDMTLAAECLERASALRPGHIETLVAFARALLACGRFVEARDAATRATALAPASADAWFLAGTAHRAVGDAREGMAALRHAILLAPAHASAHLNLGSALADLDLLDEAEAHMRHATRLDPGLPEAHASLGWLLAARGELEGSKQASRMAIELRPDFARAHWNLSVSHLLGGEFEEGWREYEWRKRHDLFAHDFPPLPGPEWQGEALAGRAILVRAEQGLGDTIQLARFLPMLAARGATVSLACAAALAPLLRTAPGVSAVVARESPGVAHDVWVDQLSLPGLLGIRLETIPGSLGYLAADPARARSWNGRLPPGLRVGLVWSGNPRHGNDARRLLATASLAPLMAVPGANFVSLQVGPRVAGISELFGVPDRSADLTDFAETAALVANLDLVVAVDTATAHLAGALGVPVWVMLPYAPDWRWMTARGDSPWYRSMRLFRQTRPGDWSGPVEAIADGLRARYKSRFASRNLRCGAG